MTQSGAQQDECFILIKAQPHLSGNYFETVCCAGIGRDGKWRRQYPVPFRILNESSKFKRWDWISYNFTKSAKDPRMESQKVVPESISVIGKIKQPERASFLNPLVRPSFEDAETRGESLALIRPVSLKLRWYEKSEAQLAKERGDHKSLANQMSLLDQTAKPLEPCPVQFRIHWRDANGVSRRHECDDWETSTAFNRFEREYGRDRALKTLQETYEDIYFEAGLALAFSTHSRRNSHYGQQNQWLLVGILRLNYSSQDDLFL